MISTEELEHDLNFLLHMYLSGSDEEVLVGNFMGDFVKGPLGTTYPPRVRQGLQLHRAIDAFAQQHELFQRSRLRLAPRFGLYRGVLVDLFYDHFLAVEWQEWSTLPFSDYLALTRREVDRHLPILPQDLQRLVPVIFDDLLPSYREISGIEAALRRMSRRVRRDNPLAEGGSELRAHYAALRDDFLFFTPLLQRFCREWRADIAEREGE